MGGVAIDAAVVPPTSHQSCLEHSSNTRRLLLGVLVVVVGQDFRLRGRAKFAIKWLVRNSQLNVPKRLLPWTSSEPPREDRLSAALCRYTEHLIYAAEPFFPLPSKIRLYTRRMQRTDALEIRNLSRNLLA